MHAFEGWKKGVNLDKNKGLSYYIFEYIGLLDRQKRIAGGVIHD